MEAVVPLVSAIITTHNRIALLKRAVRSVKEQTYKNIELIVVDDNSDDGTQQWCESQSFKYIRIDKEESKGGNYARNLGILNSNGKYIAFLDDDDYWLNEKISKQVKKLEETNNDVVHCYRKIEIVDKKICCKIINCPLNSNYSGNLSKRILYQISVLTSAMMARRETLLNAGGFDEDCKYWQEYELTIRLAQRGTFSLIPESLVVYRMDKTDTNRLTNKYNGWIDAVHYIYTKHAKLYRNLDILSKLRVKILYWGDSSNRAKAAGLSSIWLKHSLLNYCFNLPYRIYDKIRSKICTIK